jgi:hypothetical protein
MTTRANKYMEMERKTIGLQKVAHELEQVPERQSQEQCPTPSPPQAEQ